MKKRLMIYVLVQIDCNNLLSTHCHRRHPLLLPSLPTAATPFFIVDTLTLTLCCHRCTFTIMSLLLVAVPFAAAVAMPHRRTIASSLPLSPHCTILSYCCHQVFIVTIVTLLSPCQYIIATVVAIPLPSCPCCHSHCAALLLPYH